MSKLRKTTIRGMANANPASVPKDAIAAMPTTDNRLTVTREEVRRMAYLNSPKLPRTVVDDGVVKEWVGIGWVALDRSPLPTDTFIVN